MLKLWTICQVLPQFHNFLYIGLPANWQSGFGYMPKRIDFLLLRFRSRLIPCEYSVNFTKLKNKNVIRCRMIYNVTVFHFWAKCYFPPCREHLRDRWQRRTAACDVFVTKLPSGDETRTGKWNIILQTFFQFFFIFFCRCDLYYFFNPKNYSNSHSSSAARVLNKKLRSSMSRWFLWSSMILLDLSSGVGIA